MTSSPSTASPRPDGAARQGRRRVGDGTAGQRIGRRRRLAKIQAYATSNETASGAVAALTQDQEVFSSSAFTATSRVSDMDNAFTTLAGNFGPSRPRS